MVIELKEKQKVLVGGSKPVYKLVWSCIQSMQPFDREKEMFFVIGVTRALQVKFIDMVSMGTLHTVIVEPREVFRNAILHGANSIILCHNHPSGNFKPSNEDKKVTETMVNAGKILHISVVDHVIVSSDGYYSFADEGELCS
jgi:DNA repair protein RadC